MKHAAVVSSVISGLVCVSLGGTLGYFRGVEDTSTKYSTYVDRSSYLIEFGPPGVPECQTLVPINEFEKLNRMGLWRWPAECMGE